VDVAGECVLPRPDLLDAWKLLRSRWGPGAKLLPEGGRLRLTLRSSEQPPDGEAGRVALVVEGGRAGWSARPLAAAVPALAEIWHVAGAPPGADGAGDEPESEARTPRLAHGSVVDAQTPSFTQVNAEGAALLVAHVAELAGSGGHAVDAYCGVGDYGRALVAQGWRVTGIEVDSAACDAIRASAPDGLTVLEGRAEERLDGALPADLLIVNPPRAGLAAEVVGAIERGRPARLIYVSCDPATLARDVRALADTYAMTSLRCFDLFPQTAHVETVLAMTVRGA
jgi:23S rRNA (uracil1939-C5)-methyltransferase